MLATATCGKIGRWKDLKNGLNGFGIASFTVIIGDETVLSYSL
jgi:hypothetical protein